MLSKLKAFWRNTPANTRLWICAVGSGAIYVAFTAPYQLSRYYAVSPPVDYAKLTRYSTFGFLAYLVGIILLFGLFVIAVRNLTQNRDQAAEKADLRFVLGVGAVFGLILLLSYPQKAIDMLVYAIRTRGWALYGLSPFAISPDAFPASDPWLSLAGEWADAASPYGPIWEGLSLCAFYLTGGSSSLEAGDPFGRGCFTLEHLCQTRVYQSPLEILFPVLQMFGERQVDGPAIWSVIQGPVPEIFCAREVALARGCFRREIIGFAAVIIRSRARCSPQMIPRCVRLASGQGRLDQSQMVGAVLHGFGTAIHFLQYPAKGGQPDQIEGVVLHHRRHR